MVFARLHYPETIIDNTIRHFIEMRVTENVCSKQQVRDAPTRIVLPFKDQKSANAVRHQLSDLSRPACLCKQKDQRTLQAEGA